MTLLPEFLTVASWIAGGVFYDQIKIAAGTSYTLAKNLLAKELPLTPHELDIIEAEIISCDHNIYQSQESLFKFIIENHTIQDIFQTIEKREPTKSTEIVNSFKKNKATKFNLDLNNIEIIKSSFSENDNCEFKIK